MCTDLHRQMGLVEESHDACVALLRRIPTSTRTMITHALLLIRRLELDMAHDVILRALEQINSNTDRKETLASVSSHASRPSSAAQQTSRTASMCAGDVTWTQHVAASMRATQHFVDGEWDATMPQLWVQRRYAAVLIAIQVSDGCMDDDVLTCEHDCVASA